MKSKRNYLIKVSLKKKIKSKWFIGINIFLFIIMLVTININTIINMFGGDYKETKELVIKDNIGIYDELTTNMDNSLKYLPNNVVISTSNEADDVLVNRAKNNNYIFLLIDKDYDNYIKAYIYSNNGIKDNLKNIITSSLNRIRYDMALKDANLSEDIMNKINASVNLESIVLVEESSNVVDNKKSNQNNIMGVVAVIIFTMPFFFIITTLVQMIGAEINEEKSTKAMEVIISNVEAKEHLKAKIISCTMFTVIQILLIGIYTTISIIIRNKTGISIDTESNRLLNEVIANMISPSIVKSMIRILPLLIIFLIFTLITYAILAGVLASMTTNIDDFQQLQTPIMLIISASFYLSILASIFEGAKLIKVLSYFPLLSFMLSPSLYMLQQIPLSSVIVATILQVITTIIIYIYGIKVYRVGLLNYSGDHLWKKVFKALRN